METALPGVITSIPDDFADTGLVSVRPCIRKVESNGVPDLTNAEIPDVPLLRPGTEAALVELAPAAGDRVLLVFCSRDVTDWALGGSGDPDDVTPPCSGGNALTDCVAVQLGHAGHASSDAATKVTIDGGSVSVAAEGSVSVTAGAGKFEIDAGTGVVTVNGHLEVSP